MHCNSSPWWWQQNTFVGTREHLCGDNRTHFWGQHNTFVRTTTAHLHGDNRTPLWGQELTFVVITEHIFGDNRTHLWGQQELTFMVITEHISGDSSSPLWGQQGGAGAQPLLEPQADSASLHPREEKAGEYLQGDKCPPALAHRLWLAPAGEADRAGGGLEISRGVSVSRECWSATWLSRFPRAPNPEWVFLDGTDDGESCFNWNLASWNRLKTPNPQITQIQCKVCFHFYIKLLLLVNDLPWLWVVIRRKYIFTRHVDMEPISTAAGN